MSDEKDRRIHATETPDTSHIKNLDVTHETSDVQINAIGKFVVALVVLMVASFLLMWGMFRMLQKQNVDPPRSPMALTEQERLPPEPRLQSAPGFAKDLEKAPDADKEHKAEGEPAARGQAPGPKGPTWEMDMLRERWHQALEKGPIDEHGQRYGMPIEQAKDEVLKQLTTKGQAADSRKQAAGSKP